MFGYRIDGKKVKGLNIIDKAEPYFMPMRIDAVNYTTVKIPCDKMDEFIQRERRAGTSFTYMHLVIATLVRVLYMREKLNRFIMRGVIYQRNGIYVSMDVKKELSDDGDCETLKFPFTGRESIYEVKKIVDDMIAEGVSKNTSGDTKSFIEKFTKLPNWMFRWTLAIFRWLDKHGLFNKTMIQASPFHTSAFLTNLKSIKLGHIYHHLYNFGTTSIFISMGKEKMEPVVINNKELSIAKIMNLGMSLDERVADGLYMGKSLRLLQEILANPDVLKESLPDDGKIPTKLKKPKKTKKPKAKKAKPAKAKKEKVKKEQKPKKIKPLKNKEKALKREKSKERSVKEKKERIIKEKRPKLKPVKISQGGKAADATVENSISSDES